MNDVNYYLNMMARLEPAIIAEKNEYWLKIYLKEYVRCIIELWEIAQAVGLN